MALLLLRYCVNTAPNYWLRTMPPSVMAAPGADLDGKVQPGVGTFHDTAIANATAVAFQFDAASPRGLLALRQMRLPTRMGGLGLTETADIAPAAFVGSLAACLPVIGKLVPSLASIDIAQSELPSLVELRTAHSSLLATHGRIDGEYANLDDRPVGYDVLGDPQFRYHPDDLPPAESLPSLNHISLGDEYTCTQAQRRLSAIRHHDRWGALRRDLGADGGNRELVRFISASQPFAGAAFNAVPSQFDFQIPSDELLIMVQRRLGLELSCLSGITHSVALGREVDALGDTFLTYHNHSRRHNEVARVLGRAAKQALNREVLIDSFQSESFSKGARPDVAVIRGARDRTHNLLLEVKVVCPVSSNPHSTKDAGTFAGFGNTNPPLRAEILGCDSVGGRDAVDAKYGDALAKGHQVVAAVFETWGGFSPAVVDLLNDWAAAARGKTPEGQEPPWSARNFVPYWSQILSTKAQRGAAAEILSRVREETAACNATHARGGG